MPTVVIILSALLSAAAQDLTAAEYAELGTFSRAGITRQIAEDEGVSWMDLNACVIDAGYDPETRDALLAEVVPACLRWVRNQAER